MEAFEVGAKYKIKDKGKDKTYTFSAVSEIYYCGVFISEDGSNHLFQLNNMIKKF